MHVHGPHLVIRLVRIRDAVQLQRLILRAGYDVVRGDPEEIGDDVLVGVEHVDREMLHGEVPHGDTGIDHLESNMMQSI